MYWLENSEIDRMRWEKCVMASAQEHIYGYPDFLDIVSPRWAGVIVGDYEAVIPMPIKRKTGLTLLMQPLFMQRIKYFGNTALYSSEVFLKLLKSKINLFDACFDRDLSIQGRPRLNCIVPGHRDIVSTMSAHHRRNFRKSDAQGLILKELDAPDSLLNIFTTARADIHLPAQFGQILKALCEKFIPEGSARLMGIYNGEKLLGGMFILSSLRSEVLLFTAQSEDGKAKGALYFGVGNTLLKAEKTFDFEGSNDSGLRRFYMGFGATEEVYYHRRSMPLRLLSAWK
jgi:hypothetical protein